MALKENLEGEGNGHFLVLTAIKNISIFLNSIHTSFRAEKDV